MSWRSRFGWSFSWEFRINALIHLIMGLWQLQSISNSRFGCTGFQVRFDKTRSAKELLLEFASVEHLDFRCGCRLSYRIHAKATKRLCVIVIAGQSVERNHSFLQSRQHKTSSIVRTKCARDDDQGGESNRNFYTDGYTERGAPSSLLKLVKPAITATDSRDNQKLFDTGKEQIAPTYEDTGYSERDINEQVSRIKQQAITGNVTAARTAIQKLFARFPQNPRILIEFAYIETKRGSYAAATSLFSRAINTLEANGNLGYDYVLALQGWASSEVKASNPSRARALFEESIRAAEKLEYHSERATVYGLHAWALLEDKLGNWSEARDLLQRAASIQPGNAVVHQSRALMEARAHNYSSARFNFRLAVQADPDDAKCWQAWALFEAGQHRYRQMRRLFHRAYAANPKDFYTLQAWAHQEALIGTSKAKSRARRLYQRCIEVCPENMHTWQSWALLEQRSGNYQGARVLYQQGFRINPLSVPCLQAYARMERTCGNLEAARNLLQTARTVDPFNAPSLMESALVEQQLGNEDVALEFFKRARKVDKERSRIKRLMFISRKNSPRPPKAGPEISEIVKEAVREVTMSRQQMKKDWLHENSN